MKLLTINQKVTELMMTNMDDLPPKSREYIDKLSNHLGYCGEVAVTALYDYCQMELNMECEEEQYKIDNYRKDLYKTNKN